MASDEIRRVLKVFGVAVTNLDEALDRGAPANEIMKWDSEVADRMRDVTAMIDRLRSRRFDKSP